MNSSKRLPNMSLYNPIRKTLVRANFASSRIFSTQRRKKLETNLKTWYGLGKTREQNERKQRKEKERKREREREREREIGTTANYEIH